jgi:hypothetical protein
MVDGLGIWFPPYDAVTKFVTVGFVIRRIYTERLTVKSLDCWLLTSQDSDDYRLRIWRVNALSGSTPDVRTTNKNAVTSLFYGNSDLFAHRQL